MNTHLSRWPARRAMLNALVLITLGATAAQAQPQTATIAAPTAADLNAETALPYRSVFSDYQKFSDESVAPWQQTNATVEKIGGWRVYAKEARQPDAEDKTNASPDTGAHSGHGGKP